MIVTLTKQGWDIIHQQSHALLAMKLAYHWRKEDRSEHWVEVLAAITQHDHFQHGGDGDVSLTDVGAPKGFTVGSSESTIDSLEQPQTALNEAKQQSRYVGLLLSHHITKLYEPKRGASAELDAFLDEQHEKQRAWRKKLKITKKAVAHDYAVVLWCDRCSLILCQGEVPSDKRRLEVEPLPRGETSYLFQRDDKSIGSEPWPFEEDTFEVSVEVTRLTQLHFATLDELKQALVDGEVEVRAWTLRKS
jgi:Protein of unknown function (DUF3891)